MKVIILNKRKFNEFMTYNDITDDNVESKDIMIVSINEIHKRPTFFKDPYGVNSYFKRQHSNVLIMNFSDLSMEYVKQHKETPGIFTEYMAKKLYAFIKKNSDKSLAVIHCLAGISRSGAVGTFINDLYGQPYADFKRQNPVINPNSHILSLLNKELRNDI